MIKKQLLRTRLFSLLNSHYRAKRDFCRKTAKRYNGKLSRKFWKPCVKLTIRGHTCLVMPFTSANGSLIYLRWYINLKNPVPYSVYLTTKENMHRYNLLQPLSFNNPSFDHQFKVFCRSKAYATTLINPVFQTMLTRLIYKQNLTLFMTIRNKLIWIDFNWVRMDLSKTFRECYRAIEDIIESVVRQ